MTRNFVWLVLCLGAGNSLVWADLLEVSLKPGPQISGLPGDTVGWGFTMTSKFQTEWISVTGSALVFESNPFLGTYTDFVGPQGGPTDNALAPTASWTELFNAVAQKGMGKYDIDPSQPAFAEDQGSIRVFFDVFTDNPSAGGAFLASDSVDTPFAVVAAPEPVSMVLLLTCMVLTFSMARRKAAVRRPRR